MRNQSQDRGDAIQPQANRLRGKGTVALIVVITMAAVADAFVAWLRPYSLRNPALAVTAQLSKKTVRMDDRLILGRAQHAVLEAAAVMLQRALTGAWPRSLGGLTSAPPADPFTGGPLSYRVEDGGFVVYSKGTSGAFGTLSGQPTKGEAVFLYP